MERKDVALDRAQTIDREACLIGPRIPTGGENHPDARPGRPRRFDLSERATRGRLEQGDQVAVQPGQDDLRLGVPESGIELEYLDARRPNHQAGVETAAIGRAVLAQRLDHRGEHLGDCASDLTLSKEADGRVTAHAAGIRSFIAVKRSLVVAGWRQRERAIPIDQRHHGNLAAVDLLLEDDAVSRGTHRLAQHQRVDAFERLLGIAWNQRAFSLGEPIGFNHECPALAAHEILGAGRVVEDLIGGSGHAGARHQ